jgi:transcriptional regulator with XRE-family HTH domain
MFLRSRKVLPDDKRYITEDEVNAREAQDSGLIDAIEDAEHRLKLVGHLAALRRRAKLSQAEVARRMGTTQSAVSALEGGEHDPYLSTLQRYGRAIRARIEVQVFVPSWEPPEHGYNVKAGAVEKAASATASTPSLVQDLVGSWAPRNASATFHRSEVELCS